MRLPSIIQIHLWSEYVFQEKMRIFLPLMMAKYEFPWQMAKSYFVTTKENPETFLEVATLEKPLRRFCFEMAAFPSIRPIAR
jgi:hypothetical protein